jgi:hypothetical protein
MFVLGGVFKSDPSICLDEGIIQVFNLNTLQFQTSYNSSSWQDYQVPSLVTASIGGEYVISTSFNDPRSLTNYYSAHGGATKTSPNVWNDNALSQVFSSRYPKATPTYHAYTSTSNSPAGPFTTSTTSAKETERNGRSGFPSWVGSTLGIVLGLVLVMGIFAWYLRRRAHLRKMQASCHSETKKSNVQLDDLRRGARVELAANENKWSMLATPPLPVGSTATGSQLVIPARFPRIAELQGDSSFQIQEERDENRLIIGPHMDTTTTGGLFPSVSRSNETAATSVRYSHCHSESTTTCVSPLSDVDMSSRIGIVEDPAISPDGTLLMMGEETTTNQ